MQVYTNSKRQSLKIILLFVSVLFVAYLPVSTFLFFVKNDAFTGYFPPKFFMSESIHAGYLPLWNPYINYGIPQYGDMSSGFWSPITWIIAGTVGYNAYTFTLEVLAYILIGGLGMYKLSGYWNLKTQTRVIAAIAFMCCGYNVGHMQHFNWLSGAAFLPWCMWGYLLLQQSFSLKNILLSALLFYLFIASAHPGLTIGAIYFFSFLAAFTFFKNENKFAANKKIRLFFYSNLLLVMSLVLLSAGMIIGYLDILPHFSRGGKVAMDEALGNPTSFQSWVSLLMPFSITQNASLFATDISMRNTYISLLLVMMLLLTLFQKKNSWQKFLLATGFVFLLLSGGGIFKIFAYKFIPLIGFVRLDGEFRIFSLLCFILVAAMQFDSIFINRISFHGKIKWIYYSLEIFFAACIFYGLFKAINGHQSFIYHLSSLQGNGLSQKLKSLIDAITFYDTLWVQGILQMLLLWAIKWCLIKQRYNFLVQICIADLVMATLLNLPFTGVGKASVAQVQRILNQSPKGIPVPVLQPVNKIDTLTEEQTKIVGEWSFYNKQIGATQEAPYPIGLNKMKKYLDTVLVNPGMSEMENNFIFTKNTSGAAINNEVSINLFTPNKIRFDVNSNDTRIVVYQQTWYPHWFYKNGKEDKEADQYNATFMSAPLVKGKNNIEFYFNPAKVKIGMLVSLLALLTCTITLIFLRNKEKHWWNVN